MDRAAFQARADALVEQGRGATKVGRNQACWCGSGRKYKRCHYEHDQRRTTLAPMSDVLEDVASEVLGLDPWDPDDARWLRVVLDLAGTAWNLSRLSADERSQARATLLGTLSEDLRASAPMLLDRLVDRALDYPDDPRRVLRVDLVDGPQGWQIRTATSLTARQASLHQR